MLPNSASDVPQSRTAPAASRARLLLPTTDTNLFHLIGDRLTGGIAVDSAGKIYFGNGINIGSISPDGSVDAQQWLCERTGSIDGPAEAACFADIGIMCSDTNDNLYIADAGLIRKATPDLTVTTIADLHQDRAYDQRPVLEITGLAADSANHIYFCVVVFVYDGRDDKYHVFERSIIRMNSDGVVSKVIDLPQIDNLGAIRIDAEQNLYLASSTRILRISPDEYVSVFADLGIHSMPSDIMLDADGALYVSDIEQHALLRLTQDGSIETLANLDMPGPMAKLGSYRLAVIAKGGIYTIDVT